jgi:hypothetical protein
MTAPEMPICLHLDIPVPLDYVSNMRTTVRLDENLLARAKEFAAKKRMTFTKLLEESLRSFLAQAKKTTPNKQRIQLPTFRGTGVHPGVDINNSASLLDIMDGSEIRSNGGPRRKRP